MTTGSSFLSSCKHYFHPCNIASWSWWGVRSTTQRQDAITAVRTMVIPLTFKIKLNILWINHSNHIISIENNRKYDRCFRSGWCTHIHKDKTKSHLTFYRYKVVSSFQDYDSYTRSKFCYLNSAMITIWFRAVLLLTCFKLTYHISLTFVSTDFSPVYFQTHNYQNWK